MQLAITRQPRAKKKAKAMVLVAQHVLFLLKVLSLIRKMKGR